jgi:hypothetical protein
MTGRIRSIKPEWLEDEGLLRAGSDARVLSVALLLLADDYGRGRYIPESMAGQVFAFSREPLDNFREAFASLSRMGFARTYEVRQQQYFEIVNWEKHQRVDKPGKPRVPAPLHALEKVPGGLANPQETVAPDPIRSDPITIASKSPAGFQITDLTPEDVSHAWHAAAPFGVLHGLSGWRSEFNDIALTINMHQKVMPSKRRRVLEKLCIYVWKAPEGPHGSGRIKKMTPATIAKRCASDIDASQDSDWVARYFEIPDGEAIA